LRSDKKLRLAGRCLEKGEGRRYEILRKTDFPRFLEPDHRTDCRRTTSTSEFRWKSNARHSLGSERIYK
jgi:hypothetical protein